LIKAVKQHQAFDCTIQLARRVQGSKAIGKKKESQGQK